MTWRKTALVVLFPALVGLGFVLGAGYGQAFAGTGAQADRDAIFAPFWETWDLLHDSYVEELDDEALMEAALVGMMDSLEDPHSFYMDQEMFEIMNNDLSGEFEGIGATVRQDVESGALVIIDLLPESPAETAGLLPGDAIVAVNGENVTGMSQAAIISQIRGPEGTQVNLGIERNNEALTIPVVRARLELDSVQADVLDNGFVHIRLLQFADDTADALREALVTYNVDQSPGLILDMRGNPGGYLNTAVDVASEFLTDGYVLHERFREGERNYEVKGNPTAPNVPMIVLVDQGSASASELVAGALQDQGRATIVGMPTFGKATVQTWRSLSNGGGVRVTIARWYTPDDRFLGETGVIPDIEAVSDPRGVGPDIPLQMAQDLLSEQLEIAQP